MTGAGGFLGRHLMNLVESSDAFETQFVRWDRERYGSLLFPRNRRLVLDRISPTAVIHLAWAPTGVTNYQHSPANTEWASATHEFIDECTEREIWLIATGSAVDGHQSSSRLTPYGEAKQLLRDYVAGLIQSGARITWVRPQYVVSLAEARPSVLRSFLQARGASTFEPRNPDEALDFIEVRDVASAFQTTISGNLMGQVYVGSGHLHTVRQLLSAAKSRLEGAIPAPLTDIIYPARESPSTLVSHGWVPLHTAALFGEKIY